MIRQDCVRTVRQDTVSMALNTEQGLRPSRRLASLPRKPRAGIRQSRWGDDSATMSDLRIREGQPEDCDSVLALWRLAGVRPSVTDTPERLRLFIEKSGGLLLVAEVAGQRVGTVFGGWDQWRGHIYRLAVHPDYRRRGIARALVGEIERRLRDRGAARIYALTYTEDGAAFWASLPYERTSDTAFVRTFR